VPPACAIAVHLRDHKQAISDDWERAVIADLTELARLDRGALIDHLPEVLDGLAAWVDGRTADAELAFSALADGHAIQRLGFGIELAVVNIEYAWLRRVVLQHLLAVPSSPEVREQLNRLNEGLDRAIHLAVRRYTEHRDYVRDRFIGILGHDLRDPLGAASIASDELLRFGALGDEDKKLVATIQRAVGRMSRMVRDVLDFASGHLAGGIPVTPVRDDLAEICRVAVDEARSTYPKRVIELRTDGDLGGSFDRDRVLQVLGNLISNALHHGTDPVVVTAAEAADRRSVTTGVRNRGEPIPPALVPRLFEPFVHAGDSRRGSLGLGLYIVAQVARAHGGTHEVTSLDGVTTFTIRWPRTPPGETPGR
jgi:signal transduction histidine kinase